MKNIVAAFVLSFAIAISFMPEARAGLWTTLSSVFTDPLPSKFFTVEAQGVNIRGYVYELTSYNKTCVFNATESGGGGLTCFDTPKE